MPTLTSRAALIATFALLAAACASTNTASPDATPSPTATKTSPGPGTAPTQSTAPPPGHWIAVRIVGGRGEFYDTRSGEVFVPRGMNYNRFLPAASLGGLADNVFTTRYYDPAAVETDLAEMQALGFNALRVMIDTCDPADGCIATGPSGVALDGSYMDNVADFLRRARDHGFVVMLASNTLPDDSYWLNATGRLADATFQSANNEFLNPAAVPFYVDYWTKVVQALVDRRAATDAILGYELRQEHHFQAAYPPFTLSSGTVTTANGKTYDMAVSEDKARMVDEGLVHWSDTLREAIRSVDPTALVTVGFFTPNAPHPVNGPNETRLVRTAAFLEQSTADFVDLHHYPGAGVDDAHVWENFGIAGADAKPLVLGEFGAYADRFSGSAPAAGALMAFQVESCAVGFEGWFLWAWRGDGSRDLWWATDGEREIARVVAPTERPDPCQYGTFDFVRFNIAPSASVKASSQLPGNPASNVNDETPAHWNAAARSPQWVQLAMPAPARIDVVILRVAQNPAGPSVHELWIRRAGGKLTRVHVFEGVTREGDVLTYEPSKPLQDLDLVRVVTTSLGELAPAWHEIELITTVPPG